MMLIPLEIDESDEIYQILTVFYRKRWYSKPRIRKFARPKMSYEWYEMPYLTEHEFSCSILEMMAKGYFLQKRLMGKNNEKVLV